MEDPIQIGGVTPLSMTDYPGHLAAIIFCQGCPWKCRYCHNPELRPFLPTLSAARQQQLRENWSWQSLLDFLERRRGFLDAVVFSGGEPTFQDDLPSAMRKIRWMGFKVGLHTAGPDPDLLEEVLPLVDWVGMDVKAPFDKRYDGVTCRKGTAHQAKESVGRVLRSGVTYQFRTTVHPLLTSAEDLVEINEELYDLDADPTHVQLFRKEGCIDQELCAI